MLFSLHRSLLEPASMEDTFSAISEEEKAASTWQVSDDVHAQLERSMSDLHSHACMDKRLMEELLLMREVLTPRLMRLSSSARKAARASAACSPRSPRRG